MKLHSFADYAEYVRTQERVNRQKLDYVYVCEPEINQIAVTIRSYVSPQFGVCHGVRNGWEVLRLRELLGCVVVGTEISSTASQFPFVIQHDFHAAHKDLHEADFVYSNSLDHSHQPHTAIARWKSQLRPGGILIVHWSQDSTENYMSDADCFGASLDEYHKLIDATACIHENMTRQGALLIWQKTS